MDNSESTQMPTKSRKPRASQVQIDYTNITPIEKRRAYQK